MRATAVCYVILRFDMLLQLFNPYNIISADMASQSAAKLEVACYIYCVPRDQHLSIDLSVHFFALLAAAAGFVYHTAAIVLATT